jgi:acyl dehydratase
VIAAAIATRDFQDVHHDRDRAVERGGKDVFVNILTTTGVVQRYVTDWAGPQAIVRQIAIRLGVPCYAGDKLTFSGKVVEAEGGECVVEVVGRCSLGDHVTGTVRIRLREPCGPDEPDEPGGPGVPDGPDGPSGPGTPGGSAP